MAATVAVVAELGFERARVADILRMAGVSRRAFYEHFADKEACFVATIEELTTMGTTTLASEFGERSSSSLEDAFALFLSMAAEQPATAQIYLVESFAAGGDALAHLLTASAQAEGLVAAMAAGGGGDSMSPELPRAILGGVFGVMHRRLREGRAEELPGTAKPLAAWARKVAALPRPLSPWVVERSTQRTPFAARIPAERLISVFAALTAEVGYAKTTVRAVCDRAHASSKTFYRHFHSREEVLRTALDSFQAQVIARMVPMINAAADWREASRAAALALHDFYSAEPDMAYLREVVVYSAGADAVAYREAGDAAAFETFSALVWGQPLQLDQLEVEATTGAIHGLLFRGIREERGAAMDRLAPLVTYLALAPFTSPELAFEIAEEGP
jgi:AcrR family transcriptional regulator